MQRRDLAKTAAVRLGLPGQPPRFPRWSTGPEDLREAIGNLSYLAHGGNEFDGRKISPLDEAELIGIAEDIKAKGVNTIAITSVFSPGERRVREAGGPPFSRRPFQALTSRCRRRSGASACSSAKTPPS